MLAVALAAAQATLVGQEIHRLHVHADRLFLSYGDYTHNTGPIHALSLDLAAPSTVTDEATFTTEETWQARTLSDGRLAVPFVDPQGSSDPTKGALALRAVDGTWSVVTTVTDHPPIHVYDVAEHGGKLWICGAVDTGANTSDASVWWSADGGATWTWELVVSGDGFARIFALAEHAGSLYAWGNDGVDPSSGRFVRNDTTGAWTREDTGGVEQAEPVTLDAQTLILGLTAGIDVGVSVNDPGPTCFPAPTGAAATAIAALSRAIYDVHVSTAGTVYVLGADGIVYRLNSDATVTAVTLTLDIARCIAVDETRQKVYLGTRDSAIYSAPIPA